MMVKKKDMFIYSLIFLFLFASISYAQGEFISSEEIEEGTGFGLGDLLGLVISLIAVAVIVILRFLNLIPDSLYNPLLIFAFFGLFLALQQLFDAVGFEINIGGIVIPPLAIGFIMLFLVYHNAILQLLGLAQRQQPI